jgi:hypothetical protein
MKGTLAMNVGDRGVFDLQLAKTGLENDVLHIKNEDPPKANSSHSSWVDLLSTPGGQMHVDIALRN